MTSRLVPPMFAIGISKACLTAVSILSEVARSAPWRLAAWVLAATCVVSFAVRGASATPTKAKGLHVVGNRLLDAKGRFVHFRGVNRSGPEYACIQGWGIFDGP